MEGKIVNFPHAISRLCAPIMTWPNMVGNYKIRLSIVSFTKQRFPFKFIVFGE